MTAIRCTCGHYETAHNPRSRMIPAYCGACKGGKAQHSYTPAGYPRIENDAKGENLDVKA